MAYALGIDVGTTFTAAAILRDGVVEVLPLATNQVAVPSVIFAAGDEMLFGAPAERRGATQPLGLAREFKRRLGDPVPLMLSGSPYHADRLTALMAKWVLETVTAQVGSAPSSIVLTHPANWTEYQLGTLRNALADVGLAGAGLVSEPAAAALDFSAVAAVEPGSSVLVYDLGGGTFDVALLQRTGDTFEHQIEPAGIERLGGIDFDEAVFQYVVSSIPADALDAARQHPEGAGAIAALRRRCVDAKEALSSDATTDVPVMLPGYTATVRITRPEFEDMIRPMVRQTIELVESTLQRGQIDAASLGAVLLVGGSSRIPLVPQMVSEQLRLPVRVDAHPKLVVAKGAARQAALAKSTSSPARPRFVDDDDDEAGRNPLAVVAAVLVALALAGAGYWFLLRDDEGPSAAGTTLAPATSDSVPSGDSVPGPTADVPVSGELSIDNAAPDVAMRVVYQVAPEAVWDDGTPITVEDFRCTQQANLNTPGARERERYAHVVDITAGGSDQEVVVDLDEQDGSYRELFGALLKADEFADCNDVSSDMLDGIPFSGGPLTVSSWAADGGELARNERYFGSPSSFSTVRVVPTPGFDIEISALDSGDVEFVYPSFFSNMADARAALAGPNTTTAVAYGEDLELLSLQSSTGPLADPVYRRALAASIDRQAIFDTFYGPVLGGAPTQCGPVTPGPYCADAFAGSFDPDGAVALLTENGWTKNGDGLWQDPSGTVPELRFVVTAGNERRESLQAYLIPALREQGFVVVAENCPVGSDCDGRYRRLEYDLAITYASSPPDPGHLSAEYTCEEVPTPANGFIGDNWSGWCNEAASAALHAADEAVDEAERTELVRQAIGLMAEDAALLPLYQFPRLGAYRTDRVGGDVAAELGNHDAFNNYPTWTDVDGDGELRIGAEQWPECLNPVLPCATDWQRWLVQTAVFPQVFAPQADGTSTPTALVTDVGVQVRDT